MTEKTAEAHFTLDVDPEQIRAAARSMRGVAEEFAERGAKIKRTADGIGQRWTGGAARATVQEMRGLTSHLEGFAEGAGDTRAALRKLARQYRAALDEVERLNEEWRTAEAAHLAVFRSTFATPREPGLLPRKAGATSPLDSTSPLDRAAQSAGSAGLSQSSLEWAAERARLARAFGVVEEQARQDTRACAKAISNEAPFFLTPTAASLYTMTGYVGLGVTRDLPLSRYLAEAEAQDVDGDEDLGPWITERDVFGGQAFWAQKQGKAYLKALKEAGDYADDVDQATFVRSMRFLGPGLTVGFAVYDIENGESPTETVSTAAAGVGAFTLTVGGLALAAPAAPVLLVAGTAVAVSAAAAYGTKKLMRTDSIKGAVEYTDGELRFMGKQIKKRWNDIF